LYRQRTNYQTNRWNTCITWRARRSSCSDVIVPERCASYNALIFCEWHHTSLAFFCMRATHFRLADCRSSGAFLTFEMLYNYEKVRVSSPHSSVETRMPWLNCVVSAQLRINRVLVPQLNRERTGQPSVREKYAWNCSIAVLSVYCWCSDVAKVWTSSDGKKAKAMWVWICGGEYAVFSLICYLVMLTVVMCGIVRLKVSPTIRLAIKMCGH